MVKGDGPSAGRPRLVSERLHDELDPFRHFRVLVLLRYVREPLGLLDGHGLFIVRKG